MSTNAAQLAAQQAQLNATARALIRARSVKMLQPIFSQSGINPANTSTLTIYPRNVGLILGFWVKVTCAINNASGVQLDLTDFGPANSLAQIQFNDLAQNTRIQTSGWHLAMINTARGRRPTGSALVRTTGFDDPVNFGSIYAVNTAPATIAAGDATKTTTFWYYVPLAYSPDDMRGCVYANVVNATMQLLLSLPGTFGTALAVANGTDNTLAMYKGDVNGSVAAAVISSMSVTVYQEYWDQLPQSGGQVILPVTDLATVYEMKQSVLTAIPVNQETGYQYSNFRDFLSTVAVYFNGTARAAGTDVTYWSLQSANFTNIWKKEPALIALETREHLSVDMPTGVYYFPSRQRPISTTQYGNMQLILNPSTAGAGDYLLVGVEDFGLVANLSMAGSLPTA